MAEGPCRQDADFRFELVPLGVLKAARPMFALLAHLQLLHCSRRHHRHYLPPPTLVCPPQTPSASLNLQNYHQSVITRLHFNAPHSFICSQQDRVYFRQKFQTKLKLTLSTFLCSDSILIFPFPPNFVVLYIYFPFLLTSLVSFHNPISSVFHLGPPQHTFTPTGSSSNNTRRHTRASSLLIYLIWPSAKSTEKQRISPSKKSRSR